MEVIIQRSNRLTLVNCMKAIKKNIRPESLVILKKNKKIRDYFSMIENEIDKKYHKASIEDFYLTCRKYYKAWLKMNTVYAEKLKKGVKNVDSKSISNTTNK